MLDFKQKYYCLKKENKKIKKNFYKVINYIKFIKKKKNKFKEISLNKIITKFIPLLDNVKNLNVFTNKKSISYTLYFLKYIIKINKIKIIKPKKNDDFNPHIHQVIISIDKKKNKIIKVLKKGYILDNIVLRPALVCTS
ncbi:nucleotide exchange factor GrpE [Candidatus Vidania fulgoroideorum]